MRQDLPLLLLGKSCRPPVKNGARSSPSDSGVGLERNRGRDLECVALERRSALEFTKILKPDAHLLLRRYCVCCESQSVYFVLRGNLFRRNVWAVFIRRLPLAISHQPKLKAQATLKGKRTG